MQSRRRSHPVTVGTDFLRVLTTQLLNSSQRTNTYSNIYYYPRLWSPTSSSSHGWLLRDRRSRWASHPVSSKGRSPGPRAAAAGAGSPQARRVSSQGLLVRERDAGVDWTPTPRSPLGFRSVMGHCSPVFHALVSAHLGDVLIPSFGPLNLRVA